MSRKSDFTNPNFMKPLACACFHWLTPPQPALGVTSTL